MQLHLSFDTCLGFSREVGTLSHHPSGCVVMVCDRHRLARRRASVRQCSLGLFLRPCVHVRRHSLASRIVRCSPGLRQANRLFDVRLFDVRLFDIRLSDIRLSAIRLFLRG